MAGCVEFCSLGLMAMVYCWKLHSTFCCHLCAASSGVVLPSLSNTAVGGGSWTPTLPMLLSLKSFFFLLTAGLFQKQIAAKCRAEFSTVDHSHQARRTKFYIHKWDCIIVLMVNMFELYKEKWSGFNSHINQENFSKQIGSGIDKKYFKMKERKWHLPGSCL